MHKTRVVLPFVVIAFGLSGCNSVVTGEGEGEGAGGHAKKGEHQHEHEAESGKLLHTKVEKRTTSSGETIVHAGAELAGAPVVAIPDLLDKPDEWVGKTVQITGQVAAMCTHRRAWFALVPDDRSGRHVRVFSTPSFLTPEDAMGKTARAEGVVEMQEITRERARYFSEEHKLSMPAGDEDPVRQVVVRATGADFR